MELLQVIQNKSVYTEKNARFVKVYNRNFRRKIESEILRSGVIYEIIHSNPHVLQSVTIQSFGNQPLVSLTRRQSQVFKKIIRKNMSSRNAHATLVKLKQINTDGSKIEMPKKDSDFQIEYVSFNDLDEETKNEAITAHQLALLSQIKNFGTDHVLGTASVSDRQYIESLIEQNADDLSSFNERIEEESLTLRRKLYEHSL